MIVRELLTRVGFRTDRRSLRTADSAISGLKRAAGALAAVFAGGALAQGVRQMVELASDAEETRNVIRESFGQSAEAVQDWAAEQADAVGRSRYQLEEYAATLGAIITPLTGNAEASAAMSQELAQLAVDLGSFFNAAETDVLAALKSGLIGSTEPMMKFGVVMTVANLEAFRLEQGIRKSVKQMTEAEKTTLRYQFILSKTTAAQGDAARTADGYANLTKRLQANLKDLGTEIGFALLPGAIDFLNVLIGLTQTVRDNLGPALDSLLRVGRALVMAFGVIVEAIDGMTTGFKTLAIVAIVAWAAVAAPGLIVVALLGMISAAIYLLIDDLQTMGEGGKSVSGALVSEFEFLRDESGSIFGAIGSMVRTAVEYWGDLIAGFFGEEDYISNWFDLWTGFWNDWTSDAAAFISFMENIGPNAVEGLENALQAVADIINPIIENIGKFISSGEALRTTAQGIREMLPAGLVRAGDVATQRLIGAATGTNVNAPQNITVNVHATGGDPQAIGTAVATQTKQAVLTADRRQTSQILLQGGTS